MRIRYWLAVTMLIAMMAGGVALVTQSGLALPAMSRAADLPIYTDALASNWDNLSWDTTIDFSNASPVHGGNYSMAVTFDASWAGVYIRSTAISTSGTSGLRFWIHGGAAGGQQLRVVANEDDSSVYNVTAPAGTWLQVDVSWTDLGNPTEITALYWQDTTGGAQNVFYLDDILFVGDNSTPTPTPPPGVGPALSVDTTADQHPIPDEIYGMNFADEALAEELSLPVNRWGGNATTRYNWQYDISNRGSDWYFENVNEDDQPGAVSDLFVEQNIRTGTESLITIPLIGWTPKNDASACGFSISKYGPQDRNDSQWRPDCGNGKVGDEYVYTTDPLDTSEDAPPAFVTSWIQHMISEYGTASTGGVEYYNLDNEPMLWNDTHHDVHPDPTTYDEMRTRTYAYAAAVKAADPGAKTLGPVLWGWCAYFYSALDECGSGSTDYASHGNTYFVPWYLQQMQDYEDENGVRILDYLDLHYYPQANGVFEDDAGGTETQALRLRSTRALWDPTYADESWIADMSVGPYVRLIPRMKEWIDPNYPGTKLAITEYNWGAFDHINGALTQADVLGIFGREGIDLAALWTGPEADQPVAFAFRMYRNYDGNGSEFGNTGVQATSTDQGQLAIYAALRSSDGALTLLVINKTSQTFINPVSLAGFDPAPSAKVYRYSSANLAAIVHENNQPVSASGFTATFPANSITLIVIPPYTPLVFSHSVSLPLITE